MTLEAFGYWAIVLFCSGFAVGSVIAITKETLKALVS